MKKIFKLLFIALVSMPLYGCNDKDSLKFSKDDTKLFIVSDTHYLSSTLLDSNIDYDEEGKQITKDGRTVQYINTLIDKLFDKVISEKPDYFIITGDLTFNGEKVSHLELADKMKILLDNAIQPLVIPGNHDMCMSKSARDYIPGSSKVVSDIKYDEFPTIYADYGYSGAIRKDLEQSHSYIYQTKNNEWLFMLDTSLSKYNYEEGFNQTSGYFENIEWLESNLKYAYENNIKCYMFSHHNLFLHNPKFTYYYQIRNYEQILELYNKYNVNIHFSGHMHIQDIKEENGIYDICTGSLLDYGNRYGIFQTNENGMKYESKTIDFKMENGEMYSKHSYDLFTRDSTKLTNKLNIEDENQKKIAIDFASKINAYYFDGSIKNQYQKLIKEKGYTLIKDNLADFENSYINTMLVEGNRECHKLIIKNGK